MGICSSCDSTSVATAKLILQDGKLREFPCPVKVSSLLQKNPAYFICNSDDMEFDDFVSAVNSDDELQPNHLYFALPISWLKRRLRPEDMAALAVTASQALMRGGAKRCGCWPGEREVALEEVALREHVTAAAAAPLVDDGRGRRLIQKRREKVGRGRDFTSTLSSVSEE